MRRGSYCFAPGFRLFRDQERHALIVVWALSVLAAYGGDRLFQTFSPQKRRWLAMAALIVLVIALEVEFTTPGLPVLSEVNYPGWVAAVNGVAQSVIEVNGAFRGGALGAGKAQVEMKFQPTSLYVGGGISVLAVLMGVAVLVGSWRRRRD